MKMHCHQIFRRLFRFFALIVLLLNCGLAHAQMDRVEVVYGEKSADIIVRFEYNVLYQSHAPLREGKVLRILMRLVDVPSDTGFFEETLWTPKSNRIPSATVVLSRADDALLVTFSRSTKYEVQPGRDGRSLVITIPAEPLPKAAPAPTPPPPVKPAEPVAVTPPTEPKPQVATPQVPAAVPEPPVPTPPAATPAPAQPVVAAPQEAGPTLAPAPAAPADVERLANAFMDEARRAMAAKDLATVINRCYRILGMATNSQTEPAQAWIGEVREANGEIAKARAEYELYLRVFPNGPSAARVRERLAALPKGDVTRVAKKRELPKEAGPAEWLFFGSISSTYYTGKSQTDTTTLASSVSSASQSSLSQVDQKSLITSVNLNARRRDAFSDTRIVFRDTDNQNYLNSSRSYNRVYSAYIDHNDKKLGYYVRAGRQNPNGMGVLERFDGIQTGYNLAERWRVNAVYGDAVEFDSPFSKNFYGVSLDLLPEAGRIGASVYAITQSLDGLLNRRALGAEMRYFDGHITAYGLLDYDVLYHGMNIALLQGNYLADAGTNYFVVLDRRQAPSYSLTSALLTAPGLTLKDMVAAQGLNTVRSQAKAVTALSDSFSLGFTHPLSERWQVGADYRLSRISATQPVTATIPLAVVGTCVGTIDATNTNCIFDTASQSASGKTHTLTAQVVGNNLFVDNAIGVGSASYIMAPTYTGQSLSLNYVLPFTKAWRLDTNVRHYTQSDNTGGSQYRLSPSMKLSYQWQESLYFEGELGRETSETKSSTQNDHSTRDYFYAGVRWDFR